MLFSTKFNELQGELAPDRAVLIKGKALPEDTGQVRISVQDIIPLEKLRVDMPSLISIRIRLGANGGNGIPDELKSLFEQYPGAAGVRLRIEKRGDFTAMLDVPVKIRPDKDFQAEVERICGPEAYEVLAR
jgi:hypothetical protein